VLREELLQMSEHKIFWGEAHDNTYQVPPQTPPLVEVCQVAAKHLDFYAMAYYTACADAFKHGGHISELSGPQKIILERWKDEERMAAEWAEVTEVSKAHNRPGSFVTFPGYERQGNGEGGDRNVFYKTEGLPIFRVQTVPKLQDCLRGHDAIAIPHHTGYCVGHRAPDWSLVDETISPFAELYSIHGCSETDEEWVGLRQNSHMGPGAGGGTYQDALDRGLHIGAICSTDNWGKMPGHYGRGLMACLAPELTRDGLWDAFLSRRVYGVTGDRIELDFTVDGAPIGSIIEGQGKRSVFVKARGSDAIDRIEILRNGRVIATHCHQGTWDLPREGQRARFKLRVEVGWGPRPNELQVPDRNWQGTLSLSDGAFVGWEPCWISPGQDLPALDRAEATFAMVSSIANVMDVAQNSTVFEFECLPEADLSLQLNGLETAGTIRSFAEASRIISYGEECAQMLKEYAGIEPGSPERKDPYYSMAFKAKLHKAIPEAGYTAELSIEDDEPFEEEIHYRVRVEQRNGQRAWSSPIWVRG